MTYVASQPAAWGCQLCTLEALVLVYLPFVTRLCVADGFTTAIATAHSEKP